MIKNFLNNLFNSKKVFNRNKLDYIQYIPEEFLPNGWFIEGPKIPQGSKSLYINNRLVVTTFGSDNFTKSYIDDPDAIEKVNVVLAAANMDYKKIRRKKRKRKTQSK